MPMVDSSVGYLVVLPKSLGLPVFRFGTILIPNMLTCKMTRIVFGSVTCVIRNFPTNPCLHVIELTNMRPYSDLNVLNASKDWLATSY